MDERWTAAMWCTIYGLGIIGMLGIYGVVQERIMSQPYDGEYFKISIFLVLCNRIAAIIYAIFMVWAKGEEYANKAPLWKYLAISASNVSATWCQYEALKYVSFPVQMLGKSFKMMPVMVWSIIISGKKYKLQDWLIALGVTGGVTMFLLTGTIKAKHATKGTSIYGLLLLACFLAFDGFTSTFQEKLFKEHKTSKYNQMLYVNSGSATVSLASLVGFGGAIPAFNFIGKHPALMVHASELSAAAVAGQFFIYSQVKEFGALVFAATMNVRQVLALVIVFAALFYKSYMGWVQKGDDSKHAKVAQAQKEEANKIGKAVEEDDEESEQPPATQK